MVDLPVEKEALSEELGELIARDLPITKDGTTDAQLYAKAGLAKTMSSQALRCNRHIRLFFIDQGDAQIDLQLFGGTYVARTAENGRTRLGRLKRRSHAIVESICIWTIKRA